MPDISLCSNKTCPMKIYCYRHTATPDRWQSYSEFIPKGNICDAFLKNELYAEEDPDFSNGILTNEQVIELIEHTEAKSSDLVHIKSTFTYRCVCGRSEFELPKLEKFNVRCVYCGRKFTGMKEFGNGLKIIEYQEVFNSLFHRLIRWIDKLFR